MPQSTVLPTCAAPLPARVIASEAATRTRTRVWLGQLAGLSLLIATLYYVDPAALLTRISQLQLGFIAVGAALVLPQLHCLALRWRQTAQQLGVPLSQRRALREYALSMLLNLLLPFGIAGDAIRVVRHAQSDQTPGLASALHGVMLERMLGQVVVIVWALATLPLWFGRLGVGLSALGLAALVAVACLLRRLPRGRTNALLQLSEALQRLLASPRHLAAQFALSSLITLSIVAQLYCALGALDLSLSAAQATQVFPLMLLSMSVPLAFAGFGPREAVTAELYDILHLSAADGAAFALAFGAILICSSLPCLALVLCLPSADAEPAP